MVADAVVMSLGQVGSTRTENETHQLEVMKIVEEGREGE